MSIPLLIDIVVITLLIATIIYAIILNRRLETIYQSRAELKTFLESFSSSLVQAQDSVKQLQGAGESAFGLINEEMGKAQSLRDDLNYLMERGEPIANDLDDAIREARAMRDELIKVTKEKKASNSYSHLKLLDESENDLETKKKTARKSSKKKTTEDEPELMKSLQKVR